MTGVTNSVSVLIPVFNRHGLVATAIASALEQQVDGMEVVVVDNHSNDGTWELLQSYDDSRLRVFRNEQNLGLFGNFNRCADFACGKYTLFLCSDDCLTSGFLSHAVKAMEANPGVALLSSRGRYVGLDGAAGDLIGERLEPGIYRGSSISATWFWASYYLGTNIFNYPSGILIRTSILLECIPFDATLGCPADIDLFLRILQKGDLLISSSVGCEVAQHEGQETNGYRRNADLMRQQFILLERYRPILEAVGAYDGLARQIATLVLSTIVRMTKVDRRLAARLYREFGINIFQMLGAAAVRVATQLSDRLGSLTIPYIVKLDDGVEGELASHVQR